MEVRRQKVGTDGKQPMQHYIRAGRMRPARFVLWPHATDIYWRKNEEGRKIEEGRQIEEGLRCGSGEVTTTSSGQEHDGRWTFASRVSSTSASSRTLARPPLAGPSGALRQSRPAVGDTRLTKVVVGCRWPGGTRSACRSPDRRQSGPNVRVQRVGCNEGSGRTRRLTARPRREARTACAGRQPPEQAASTSASRHSCTSWTSTSATALPSSSSGSSALRRRMFSTPRLSNGSCPGCQDRTSIVFLPAAMAYVLTEGTACWFIALRRSWSRR